VEGPTLPSIITPRTAAAQDIDLTAAANPTALGDRPGRSVTTLPQPAYPSTQLEHHPANPGTGTLELLIREMALQREQQNVHMREMYQLLANTNSTRQINEMIPQCPPQGSKEDITEFLQVFEDTQIARKNPPENWSYTLIPLLNRQAKTAISEMPADRKHKYKHLKSELLATNTKSDKHLGKAFWEYEKLSGSTWRETLNILLKKLRKFAPGPTAEECRDQVAKEKLLQLLPFRAQAFVREREPTTALEAADLAASYFYSHNMDESKWESNYNKKKGSYPSSQPQNNNFKQDNQGHPQRDHKQRRYNQTGKPHALQPNSQPPSVNEPSKGVTSQTNQQGHSTSRNNNFNPNIICLKCGERGHKAEVCLKVNLVAIPCLFSAFASPPVMKPGKIGDKEVTMLMDSGADSAIIAKELLPDTFIQCMPVAVSGVNSKGSPRICQTALFSAELDGIPFQMFAAIADGKDLPHSCIMGRSVPGLDIKWDITVTSGGEGGHGGEARETTSQVVEESALDPTDPQQLPPTPPPADIAAVTVTDALSRSWDFSGEGGPLKHGGDVGLGGPAQQVTAHPHQQESTAQSH